MPVISIQYAISTSSFVGIQTLIILIGAVLVSEACIQFIAQPFNKGKLYLKHIISDNLCTNIFVLLLRDPNGLMLKAEEESSVAESVSEPSSL